MVLVQKSTYANCTMPTLHCKLTYLQLQYTYFANKSYLYVAATYSYYVVSIPNALASCAYYNSHEGRATAASLVYNTYTGFYEYNIYTLQYKQGYLQVQHIYFAMQIGVNALSRSIF